MSLPWLWIFFISNQSSLMRFSFFLGRNHNQRPRLHALPTKVTELNDLTHPPADASTKQSLQQHTWSHNEKHLTSSIIALHEIGTSISHYPQTKENSWESSPTNNALGLKIGNITSSIVVLHDIGTSISHTVTSNQSKNLKPKIK